MRPYALGGGSALWASTSELPIYRSAPSKGIKAFRPGPPTFFDLNTPGGHAHAPGGHTLLAASMFFVAAAVFPISAPSAPSAPDPRISRAARKRRFAQEQRNTNISKTRTKNGISFHTPLTFREISLAPKPDRQTAPSPSPLIRHNRPSPHRYNRPSKTIFRPSDSPTSSAPFPPPHLASLARKIPPRKSSPTAFHPFFSHTLPLGRSAPRGLSNWTLILQNCSKEYDFKKINRTFVPILKPSDHGI